jgi:hypothetical protein
MKYYRNSQSQKSRNTGFLKFLTRAVDPEMFLFFTGLLRKGCCHAIPHKIKLITFHV